MKIYVCQTSPKTGDLEHNANNIMQLYRTAHEQKADICVFPEMCVSGYMVGDLLNYPKFISQIVKLNEHIIRHTHETHLMLPTISRQADGSLLNCVIIAKDGKIIAKIAKTSLPAYGIFEEPRYFQKGKPGIVEINGYKIGVPICADLWSPHICYHLKEQGAQLLIAPNASPFDRQKISTRESILKDRYRECGIPIIYCNQFLAQDGVVFDGNSVCYDGKHFQYIGANFATSESLVNFKAPNRFDVQQTFPRPSNVMEDIKQAMIIAVRSYVRENGFSQVVLGLSGGIDSALVAYVAAQALGSENVKTYMLKSPYTSKLSEDCAATMAKNLGIQLETIDIDAIYQQFMQCSSQESGSITAQNLQSRIRGTLLMMKANEQNALLLTTGNKSEYAVGYATIYGDMNGAFNPIKDLYKSDLYKLVAHINEQGPIFPKQLVEREPSAELASNQIDSQSLPPYQLLDKILYDHVECQISFAELAEKYPKDVIEKVKKLFHQSEFKRQQAAPGVKLSTRCFDKEWRMPITASKQ